VGQTASEFQDAHGVDATTGLLAGERLSHAHLVYSLRREWGTVLAPSTVNARECNAVCNRSRVVEG